MAYVTAEARQRLLDTLAEAIDEVAAALAAIGDAYEGLDEQSADRLEDQLFRPVQTAYGRARRTHAEFAARHSLPARTFGPVSRRAPGPGVKGALEGAMDALGEAELILAELQDSMLPVEVGDPEVRNGLADLRQAVTAVGGQAEGFVRLFGR